MKKILKCAVCLKKDFSLFVETKDYFFTNESFSLEKCNACGFVFTNPLPLKENLGKYYETEEYLSHDSNKRGIIKYIYKIVREINLKNKYGIISRYMHSGKILDIGSGTGEFLNYFKNKGWKTIGIEPNQEAREFAVNNYQLSVVDEKELDLVENNSQNVVTMWHVLEHVYDLDERMETLHRILKKDGILVVALPMIDSPDSIKFGKYWSGLDVPRHLYHFSSSTFELLAKRYKFNIIDKLPMKFDSLYVSWLSHKAKKSKLSFLRGIFDGIISNMYANKSSNYSSMIFVMKKV